MIELWARSRCANATKRYQVASLPDDGTFLRRARRLAASCVDVYACDTTATTPREAFVPYIMGRTDPEPTPDEV